MSPRIANKDRAELPKPQVQIGVLGFSPINALNISYRHRGVGDAILSIPCETTDEAPMQARTSFQAILPDKPATKIETIELGSAAFRGLSDALYRGKLPQVLLLSPSATQMPAWLNEMMDYVEKTLQFGFFLRQNPVDNLFPNMVFISEGVYFSRLIKSFDASLRKFSALTPQWRKQILSKCHRAVLIDEASGQFFDASENASLNADGQSCSRLLDAANGGVLSLVNPPMTIRLACGPSVNADGQPDGLSPHLDVIESVLALHGFCVQLENATPNAAERLEFSYALSRSSQVLLPALNDKADMAGDKRRQPGKGETSLQEQVSSAIVRIGQKLMAFGVNEFSGALSQESANAGFKSQPVASAKKAVVKKGASKPARAANTKPASADNAVFTLSPQDLTILDSLCHYASDLELVEERELFGKLDQRLKAQYFASSRD